MSEDRGGAPRHVRRQGRRAERAGLRRLAGVTVPALLLLATVLPLTISAESSTPEQCPDGSRRLDLLAAPDVAPLLAAATRTPSAAGLDACLEVRVAASDPADVAASLRSRSPLRADGWVPDSSLWLTGLAPAPALAAPSVAMSPVVLAVARDAAAQLGWPARPPDVVPALAGTGQPMRLVLPDPARSSTAQIALADLARLLSPAGPGRAALAHAVRTADRVDVASDDVLGRLAGGAPLAVPVSEQRVWRHSSTPGPAPVVPWRPPDGAVLDHPLVDLTTDATGREDLRAVAGVLRGEAWRALLAGAGFRSPDAPGRPPAAPGPGLAVGPVDGRVPDPAAVRAVRAAYDQLTRGMRMLAVLDVSGSMAEPVPAARGRTRMDLAAAAAVNGLALLPDDAEVGLWVFATRLTGTADHRQLVPVGRLGTRPDGTSGRAALVSALGGVAADPDGDTGLYDSVLAAVRALRADWDPTRVNSVVVITDGRNDDDQGASLQQLLHALAAEQGTRPVPVIGIAYGREGDDAPLREIARVTGGSAYTSREPADVDAVLRDALAQRICRPGC